jgi:hypothetical protein
VERRDEGRQGSGRMVAEPCSEAEGCEVGGSCGHVSIGKSGSLGDPEMIGSTSLAVEGMTGAHCLGRNAGGETLCCSLTAGGGDGRHNC